MNLALELFLIAAAVIFSIVILAEVAWKLKKMIGRRG